MPRTGIAPLLIIAPCLYSFLDQAELAGFYRDADVALVTPLRDGMNLVAKEFVACRTREPGVLILSPFAGAAGMMLEVFSNSSLLLVKLLG